MNKLDKILKSIYFLRICKNSNTILNLNYFVPPIFRNSAAMVTGKLECLATQCWHPPKKRMATQSLAIWWALAF